MLDVVVRDGETGKAAKVTSIGQLVVAPFAYDDTVFRELAVDDTAYNFYKPKAGQQLVITSIWFRADKDVSNISDATVVIYEATTDATIAVSKVLIQYAVVRDDIVDQGPLNLLVTEGRYVNAKTDDDDIHMTILGHYIEALP